MATPNSVHTLYRPKSLAQITSGAIASLPKIAYIALGTGGVNEGGEVIPPAESQTALKAEAGRYPVGPVEYPVETTARYSITVPESELAGVAVSELGLLDAEGNLCAVRNCSPKIKDADEEFTFEFEDAF